jgi:hypothetical protein
LPAFSQLVVSLVLALADSVGSFWTVCLHLSTSCFGVTAGTAPVPVAPPEALVAVALVEVADVELLLLPQPARSAPAATVTSSHVDSFRIK